MERKEEEGGRKEEEGGIIGNRDTQQRERGTFRACALPCEGKCPYLSSSLTLPGWPYNGSLEDFFFAYYESCTNVGP